MQTKVTKHHFHMTFKVQYSFIAIFAGFHLFENYCQAMDLNHVCLSVATASGRTDKLTSGGRCGGCQ